MNLPPDLHTSLEAHAQRHGLSLESTMIHLLRLALQQIEASRIGGRRRAEVLTAEERSAIARKGGLAPRKG